MKKRRWLWLLLAIPLLMILGWIYVHTHPLVFMDTHQHCIRGALNNYAGAHEGRFPNHPAGYGNALLLLEPYEPRFNTLTGPGYDTEPFREALRTNGILREEDCGRVYIQGLNVSDPALKRCEIVVLFDKLPTPGGDHCYFWGYRIFRSLCREVLYADGSTRTVEEGEWPAFAQEQVNLLVQTGYDRAEAERLYASRPKGDAGTR